WPLTAPAWQSCVLPGSDARLGITSVRRAELEKAVVLMKSGAVSIAGIVESAQRPATVRRRPGAASGRPLATSSYHRVSPLSPAGLSPYRSPLAPRAEAGHSGAFPGFPGEDRDEGGN